MMHKPFASRWASGFRVIIPLIIAIASPAPAMAAGGPSPQQDLSLHAPESFTEITPQMHQAVQRGQRWLTANQAPNGSWGAERYGSHVGITALACMSLMANGHLPGRGAHGSHVQRGLEFILRHVQETGLISADTSHGPMYGHGFAVLFLAEVYGMTHDPRVREALVKSTRLIVTTQNHEGGWRYHPVPFDADISVTICQVMALRAARNAGIDVPRETIERAIAYVRQCQNPADGGFRYMLNAGGSAFPRSAAGVATLYYAGIYQDEALDKGLDYLMRQRTQVSNRGIGHYFYGHYYAVQAMFLAGGEHWAQWYPTIRDELISQQQDDGSWTSNHGESYGTAMALLTLQVPNRLLPIFQR